MTEYVVIRLASDTDVVEWVNVDSEGTRQSGVASGTIEDAALHARDGKIIVLVPATDVLTTTATIPMRSAAKIRAALPFALEEFVADELDALHFASGNKNDNGEVPVAVVSDEKMQDWVGRLADAGIEPLRMVPENYGLAVIPGTMSMLVDNHCILFNDGASAEFAMQDVKPSDLLVAAGCLEDKEGDDSDNGGHLIAFCSPESELEFSYDWDALRHELHSVDVTVLPEGVLPKLAVTVASGRGVNLLQGDYGSTTEYAQYLRPWKTAAVLLIGLGLVAFSSIGIDYFRLSNERSELQAQFSAEYRTLRPGDTREIVDPVNTVNSLRLGQQSSAAPQVFLPTLSVLASALETNKSATLEAISYRAGIIDIRLSAPDVATLDSIQRAVSSSDRFDASIQSSEKVADEINGRIRIRASGQ